MHTFNQYRSELLESSLPKQSRDAINSEIAKMVDSINQNPKVMPDIRYTNISMAIRRWTESAGWFYDIPEIEYTFKKFLELPMNARKVVVDYTNKRSLFRGVPFSSDDAPPNIYNTLVDAIKKDKFAHIAKIGNLYWYRTRLKYIPNKEYESWSNSESTANSFAGIGSRAYTDHFVSTINRILMGDYLDSDHMGWEYLKNLQGGVLYEMDDIPFKDVVVSPPFIDTTSSNAGEGEFIIRFPNKSPKWLYAWIPATVYYSLAYEHVYKDMPNGVDRMYREMSKYFPGLPKPKHIDTRMISPSRSGRNSENMRNHLVIGGKRYFKHPNGGGLVAETSHATSEAYIDPGVIVHDRCRIDSGTLVSKPNSYGHLQLHGNCVVSGDAVISCSNDPVVIRGNCHITNRAEMRLGGGIISGDITFSGSGLVCAVSKIRFISKGKSSIILQSNAHESYNALMGNIDIVGRVKITSAPTAISINNTKIRGNLVIQRGMKVVAIIHSDISAPEIVIDPRQSDTLFYTGVIKSHSPVILPPKNSTPPQSS